MAQVERQDLSYLLLCSTRYALDHGGIHMRTTVAVLCRYASRLRATERKKIARTIIEREGEKDTEHEEMEWGKALRALQEAAKV